ncbi:MAG TPA: hypothetical protein VGC09_04315 [Rhodopila sp.]
MTDRRFESQTQAQTPPGRTRSGLAGLSRPYVATVLIVTILLSIWIGLCAA